MPIFEFSILRGVVRGENTEFRKIWIFEHNSALNYSTAKKSHMQRLNLNIKKPFLTIFKFSILSGKIAKFRKIRIFKHNCVLNMFTVKKFHIRELDLNAKKTTFGDILIFEFNMENH